MVSDQLVLDGLYDEDLVVKRDYRGLAPFTSESVTEGHPDKVCDQISDAILDAVMLQDPKARVAVETVATNGLIHVIGEMTTTAYVEIPAIVRETLLEIGYDSTEACFDGNKCGITVSLGAQSPDIAGGVNTSLESRNNGLTEARDLLGAGDQGIMFGYACSETPELMPAPILLANKMSKKLAEVRKNDVIEGLLPDGKTQVTLLYDGDVPVAVDNVVVSTQHLGSIDSKDLEESIIQEVILPVLETIPNLDVSQARFLVNPSGKFVQGGPGADSGLTGRKIIVDTYGGSAPHGGGAFSSKDATKVDRSASYAARWIAKNVVASGLATKCMIQLGYAIGSSQPVSVFVDSGGTGVISDYDLSEIVRKVFDLRPLGIIEDLGLQDPSVIKYKDTAAYGHFGRSEFPWEALDKVDELLAAVGMNQDLK